MLNYSTDFKKSVANHTNSQNKALLKMQLLHLTQERANTPQTRTISPSKIAQKQNMNCNIHVSTSKQSSSVTPSNGKIKTTANSRSTTPNSNRVGTTVKQSTGTSKKIIKTPPKNPTDLLMSPKSRNGSRLNQKNDPSWNSKTGGNKLQSNKVSMTNNMLKRSEKNFFRKHENGSINNNNINVISTKSLGNKNENKSPNASSRSALQVNKSKIVNKSLEKRNDNSFDSLITNNTNDQLGLSQLVAKRESKSPSSRSKATTKSPGSSIRSSTNQNSTTTTTSVLKFGNNNNFSSNNKTQSTPSIVMGSATGNKNSLIQQYEEIKRRSNTPIIMSWVNPAASSSSELMNENNRMQMVSTNRGLNMNMREEMPFRGQFSSRDRESEVCALVKGNCEDVRENKFTNEQDFRTKFTENEAQKNNNGKDQNNNLSLMRTSNNLLSSKSNTNIFQKKIPCNNLQTEKTILSIKEISRLGFAGIGMKKVNQDNYFIHNKLNDEQHLMFLGVCDGHGMYGHEVSAFIKENLPKVLDNEMKRKRKYFNEINMNQLFDEVFLSVNLRLVNDVAIDTMFSGSTCVSVAISPEKIMCANVGDSRAILGRYVNGIWTSQNLSRDHKPTEKDEAQRIKKRNGRIEPYKDEKNEFIGPPRVWLKNEEIPGLAMTRCFGDEIAASVGIIAEPEIQEWKYTPEDKFIVLASDGVWEFITSEECVNLVKDFYLRNDISSACESLYKESSKRWLAEEEVIDDITAIIVFID